MLIFDYVQASEIKSPIQKQDIQSMQLHESIQPSSESVAESPKSKCSETNIILASKVLIFETPNVTGCEDDTARYVTILKIMIRKYSPQILHQLFDYERRIFPVFEQLVQYSIHEDVMIKNAARLSLLIILKECRNEVQEYIIQYGASNYAATISLFLKRIVSILHDSVRERKEKSISCAINRFEEEIEYLDDVFCLKHEVVIFRFRTVFIQKFVIPILILIAEKNLDSGESEIALRIGLFLVGKLLQIVTDKTFTSKIIELLLPVELKHTRINHFNTIFNATSIKEILKFRDKIFQKIKNIVSYTELSFLQICALRILCITIKSYLHHNDYYGDFVMCTSLIELLMKRFSAETNLSKLEIKMLNLTSSILESLAKAINKCNDKSWFEVKTYFATILQTQYLESCKQLSFGDISKSAAIIDGQYNEFLKNYSNFSNVSDDNFFLIPNRNNDVSPGIEYKDIDITLRKLFHLRCLCLHLFQKKEKILPLLQSKIEIDEIIYAENSIPCEISVHDTYAKNCFLKFTSSQILILQDNGNNKEGTVVFRSFYKDLLWKKCNETLLLRENTTIDKKYVPIMQLKLIPSSQIYVISKTLTIAKQKQNEILKRKLDDLLETGYIQNERNFKENILNGKL